MAADKPTRSSAPDIVDSTTIACTLDPDQASDQLDEWHQLVETAIDVDRTRGRLSMNLPISELAAVEDLALSDAGVAVTDNA